MDDSALNDWIDDSIRTDSVRSASGRPLDQDGLQKRVATVAPDDIRRIPLLIVERLQGANYNKDYEQPLLALTRALLHPELPLTSDDLGVLLLWYRRCLRRYSVSELRGSEWDLLPKLLACLESQACTSPLPQDVLQLVREVPVFMAQDAEDARRYNALLAGASSAPTQIDPAPSSAAVADGMRPDSELESMLDSFLAAHGEPTDFAFDDSDSGRQISGLGPADACRLLVLTARHAMGHLESCWVQRMHMAVARELLRPDLPLSAAEVESLIRWYRSMMMKTGFGATTASKWNFFGALIPCLETLNRRAPFSRDMRRLLREMPYSMVPDWRLEGRYWALLGERQLILRATDVWACQAVEELLQMAPALADAWDSLFLHCATATSSKPSAKWLKTAGRLVEAVGREEFRGRLYAWLALTDRPREVVVLGQLGTSELELDDMNADILRGLVWCASLVGGPELPGVLVRLAQASYRKLPMTGVRAGKIGNAAVWALGALPGLSGAGALATLKSKVKVATAQKLIESALAEVAQREGMAPEEIEELSVPGYGMEAVGLRSEILGDHVGELRVDLRGHVDLQWRDADGKVQKSVPAPVKEAFADDLKELKIAAKEVPGQLTAQKERIDRLFIQEKCWPYPAWRERYADHPLVGIIARRLIWCFEHHGQRYDGTLLDGVPRDRDGKAFDGFDADTRVSLWHPLDHAPADVLAWRIWFEERQVTQPLKQAHREVYRLTPAERATRTYSNRFAAHILRQHQFHALCGVRGWRNRLLVSMDEDCQGIARRELGRLRAEYWIAGIGEYGTDTLDSGAYVHVATDQVRFYAAGATATDDALPLDQVPPRVFSEIMRDVDLFVGVASVGNDPTWTDNGVEARRNYWRGQAFGELSETAQTRRDVLSRLLPRLKIGPRCSLTERFLEVQGNMRRYRIHLGSGNILMAPNDEYLCIVVSREQASDKIFLPFDGDNMLSIILSKAFLLADDHKITDPSIRHQLQRA
jgi:hypothetical protein